MTTTTDRFTSADLECLKLPAGWRAEVIDGELFVSKAPSWDHEDVVYNVLYQLHRWASAHGGRANGGVGVIYADDDDVIPDVVWVSEERFKRALDGAGHLRNVGPDLAVEVVSPGPSNATRDYKTKLALYSRRDAREYWVVDPQRRAVQVFTRPGGDLSRGLELWAEFPDGALLTSPLLTDLALPVSALWPGG
jgi:Uma2 family endonuclease